MRQLQINIDGTVNRYDKQYLYYKSLLEYYDQEGLTYPQPAEIQGLAAQCALDISAQGGMDAASWAKKALTHAQQELELDIVANGRDSPVVRKSKTRFLAVPDPGGRICVFFTVMAGLDDG
ncbi:MAG: hypothetical protein Q9201_004754 [Fulgogasparrea decipioides]